MLGRSAFAGVKFAWLGGSVPVSYIAFAEAAKYTVPAVPARLGTEIAAGFVQFTICGVLPGLIHARFAKPALAPAPAR